MKKILKINQSLVNPPELVFAIDEAISLENVKASGQMLVDSAECSFVYLLENDEAYTYLKIPESLWNDLREALARNLRVTVINGKQKITLVNFLEELSYLIENIKGNSNYGEEMVQKVEVLFQ